ncbi:mechanosensitive ion channel family protein [Chitinophaga sp. S165]|uniref:mechanosensitive ion channel family protein n=1 Tax=Chitinophaga sp. S165 TaxID=2135462 RepID=UPI000D7159D5|nr:mechanosensitive ion channel family protein [Chitinophaga sp. S165]PWV51693.1 small-conductance mechanosensitive channel [Chitinophaga sp. S165]
MDSYLEQFFLGNTLKSWIVAASIIILAFVAIRIFVYILVRKMSGWAQRTAATWDDFLIVIVKKSVVPALYVAAVYFALSMLTLPVKAEKFLHVVFVAAVTFFVLRMISAIFKRLIFSYIKGQEGQEDKEKQTGGLIVVLNAVIWILGIIFFIDNLGYNVTTLIAGLGIGGIAIALAAQTILGDLFSYFVIFFDRPFEIGDFIIVDDKMGVVEYIGIKTTRLRTLNGEQLVCSNTDLTNARLHNYKRMQKRRVVFTLGVTYQTSHAKLSQIPEIVKGIITSRSNVQFDRGHFSKYGAFSLDFEFVYYILDAEYNTFMDEQQAIYLAIFAAFEQHEIEFAYPTQTLFVDRAAGGLPIMQMPDPR